LKQGLKIRVSVVRFPPGHIQINISNQEVASERFGSFSNIGAGVQLARELAIGLPSNCLRDPGHPRALLKKFFRASCQPG
jgi:hypothetical protein